MRYAVIVFLLICTGINSQIVTKKNFRLKENKTFFLNNELSSSNPKLFNKTVTLNSIVKTGYKSPWISFAASFFVPGAALGQLYNEQYLNFGIRLGISTIALSILLLQNYPCGECSGFGASLTPLWIYLLNWISSFIEAPISSASINKKNGR